MPLDDVVETEDMGDSFLIGEYDENNDDLSYDEEDDSYGIDDDNM
jgi:hypothetical protein